MKLLSSAIFWVFLIALSPLKTNATDLSEISSVEKPSVGVFYYPGWREGAKGLTYSSPWQPIKKFPDLEPLLGWYDDSAPRVIAQQAKWMREYGLDYVVFDSYWGKDGAFLDHAIQQYKKLSSADAPPFAIMWANHTEDSTSVESFQSMIDFWIENYLKQPNYLRLQNDPVIYIFSLESFQALASKLKLSVKDMLEIAQNRIRSAGLNKAHFSLGVTKGRQQILLGEASGVDSFFAYNYQYKPDTPRKRLEAARTYEDLDEIYRAQWRQLADNSTTPFFLPATTGWNKRPWGGSGDPNQDYSISSPESFAKHLQAAGEAMRGKKKSGLNSILICCWNEYGEGSILEPSKKLKFEYLDVVRKFKSGQLK